IKAAAVPVGIPAMSLEFSRYLRLSGLVALVLFVAALAGGYYRGYIRHGAADRLVFVTGAGGFLGFLLAQYMTERLYRRMRGRVEELRKESMSRLFRHFLYAGGLMGMAAVFGAALYIFLVQLQKTFAVELFLMPAY